MSEKSTRTPDGETVAFPRSIAEAWRQFTGDGRSAHPFIQFCKYAVAGGVATLVNIITVFSLCWWVYHCITPNDPVVKLFSLHPQQVVDEAQRARLTNYAYVWAFFVSNAVCYILNRALVFVPGRHSAWKEFALFMLVGAIALGAGALASYLLIKYAGTQTSIGILANLVSSLAINFLLRKTVVFAG